MKKLFLALVVLGLISGTSLTAFPYEDRRDHDWNDEYWHHHHYGYWHGERGYWRYQAITSMNSSESARNVTGLRTRVADKGITFNAQYVAEVWGNPTGGVSTGTVYTGLMSLQGNVDLQKLLGWRGASFSTRWYWLSGQDISAEHVGNIFTVSNIAGFPTVRMNELWFQQNFLGRPDFDPRGAVGSRFRVRSLHPFRCLSQWNIWLVAVSLHEHPKWRPSVSHGYTGDPVGAYASKLAELPGGCLSGQSLCPKRQSLWIPMGPKCVQRLFLHSRTELPREPRAPDPAVCLAHSRLVAGSIQRPIQTLTAHNPGTTDLYFVADQMLYRVADSDFASVTDNNGQQTAAASPTNKGLGIFTHIGFSPTDLQFH